MSAIQTNRSPKITPTRRPVSQRDDKLLLDAVIICEDFRYARTTVDDIPIIFFDYHHSRNHDPTFLNQRRTLYDFKAGFAYVVNAFAARMTRIALDAFGRQDDGIVVPVLGSGSICANPNSPISIATARIAQAIDATPNLQAFYQRQARRRVHGSAKISKIGRQDPLSGIYGSHRELRARRVFIVDDVLTTGATMRAYNNVAAEHGAIVAGAIVAMRTNDRLGLLNSAFYDDLQREWLQGDPMEVHDPGDASC